MKILFMGTPDFAATCLHGLLENGYDVAAVISQPDRPSGRGYKLKPTPVKQVAIDNNIPVYQPEKIKTAEGISLVKSIECDIIAVVAYGGILPAEILGHPPLGCINVHASLLPKYRGAAPIQWSIINGDSETGVTTMYMSEKLDEGDMLLKYTTPINKNETSGELFERLAELSSKCLVDTLGQIALGKVSAQKQDDNLSSYTSMISKEMSYISFDKSGRETANLINGLSPMPSAKIIIDGKIIKLLRACEVPCSPAAPGTVIDRESFTVACKENAVQILELQPAGKKAMPTVDFLKGYKLPDFIKTGGN